MTPWRTSSYSSSGGSTCVEAASADRRVLVRDTTDREAGHIAFSSTAWRAFTAGLK